MILMDGENSVNSISASHQKYFFTVELPVPDGDNHGSLHQESPLDNSPHGLPDRPSHPNGAQTAADDRFEFETVEIDANIGKVCYAVNLCDVDGDGRLDVVAVTDNSVFWYQNPGWQKRVIIENQTPLDNVCIAPHDIDGDGLLDFALGAGWTTKVPCTGCHAVNRSTNAGTFTA